MSSIIPDIADNILLVECKSFRKRPLLFLTGCLICAGLTTLFLLALVRYADPTAKIVDFQFSYKDSNGDSSVWIQTKVMNKNLFRAFNYSGGYMQLYYIYNNNTPAALGFDYQSSVAYQRPLQPLIWNFTIPVDSISKEIVENLQANKGYFYVYMFVGYQYKIFMSWTTNTFYYQWLEGRLYLDYDQTSDEYKLRIPTPVHLHRPDDLRWAMKTF